MSFERFEVLTSVLLGTSFLVGDDFRRVLIIEVKVCDLYAVSYAKGNLQNKNRQIKK
jgi:hypothetical protein